ncbi:MAG: hypothetical protein JXR63_10795, partial [Spirochaetales bacterium]|nr:hypothetical protein [Spirochaetales bacterium]
TIFDKISCNTLDQNRFSTALVYGRPFKIEDDCDRQKCEKKIMRLKGVLSEKKEKALEIFGIDVKEVVF